MKQEREWGVLRRFYAAPAGRSHRSRRTGRKLAGERLEGRMLLSANSLCVQNFLDPEDVTVDGAVTAWDALVVINRLNVGGAGETSATDVNGDGQSTPVDAVMVVNRLNGGWSAERAQLHIDRIQAALDSGDLPAGVTAEQATARIAALENVLLTGERPEGPCLDGERLEGVGGPQARGGNGDWSAARIQTQSDRLHAAMDSGELPAGVTAEQVGARLESLQHAWATGERPDGQRTGGSARPAGVGGPQARGGNGDSSAARVHAQIDRLPAAVDGGDLPAGVTAAQVEARRAALEVASGAGQRPAGAGQSQGGRARPGNATVAARQAYFAAIGGGVAVQDWEA